MQQTGEHHQNEDLRFRARGESVKFWGTSLFLQPDTFLSRLSSLAPIQGRTTLTSTPYQTCACKSRSLAALVEQE